MIQDTRRRPWRAVVPVAAAGIALLAAACTGGSGSPTATGSSAFQEALAYAKCMRSHGIPDFPDPTGDGFAFLPPAGFNPHSPQVRAAQRACGEYSSAAGKILPPG